MSLQRSPPINISTDSTRKLRSTLIGYGSDSQISNKSSYEHTEGQTTPPSYVCHRSKRLREKDVSPSDLASFKDEIKELITSLIGTQKKDIAEITHSLRDIKQTNLNIETSISVLTKQNEEFREKIDFLERQAKKDKEYITILEDRVEDLQRYTRKSSLELKNVPRKQQENRNDLIDMVVNLTKTIGLDFSPRDVTDIFRLKSRREVEKSPPIIVELSSTITRTDLLKKAKEFNHRNKIKLQAKHLGFSTHEDTPIFISEQLTAKAARLYFLSRELVKSQKYKYCWTAFGKVFVRKDDNAKIILIQNEAIIHRLLQEI